MDLKNSEELKSTLPSEPEQPTDAVDVAETSAEKKGEKENMPNQETEIVAAGESLTDADATVAAETSAEVKAKTAKPRAKKKKEPEVIIEEAITEVSEDVPGALGVSQIQESTSEAIEVIEEVQQPVEEAIPFVENEGVEPEPAIEEMAAPVAEKIVEEPAVVEEGEAEADFDGEGADDEELDVSDGQPVEVDYSEYSQPELVNAFRDLLDQNQGEDIKGHVEAIKTQFYKILTSNIDAQKKKFLEDGGVEEEFIEEEDPYEQDIRDLLKRYRNLRIEFNKKQEVVKEENLKQKYQVIEEIKNLINREESINKTFHEFRDLQAKWREIGLVPQSKMKDLWETYNFHVENFYDFIKINKELRDLDLRKNLESKLKLCERAEELLIEPSIIKAFNSLQKLHERWREIGPVPGDKKDEIWERFKTSTAKINKKHQDFFDGRKAEQKKNLDAKMVLCEKAEEIGTTIFESNKEWDAKSKEMVELQKVWRTIGFAPKKENNKIYDRFRVACDKFFDNRREFYGKTKEVQQNNLQMKIDLCVQAEALKDSTDWKKTTQDFINIQKKWKEVGPISRKHSDQVWKRFRAACDSFFEMKSKHFHDVDGEQGENLAQKEALIKEVTEFSPSRDVEKDLKILKDFQRRWTEIGHVPIKMKDSILNRFREAINKHFDDLKLDDSKRNILNFRNKVSNFSESSKGKNKMWIEREKYVIKLKQLENDLTLLDNNIGFFAQSKKAESLIADVNEKIAQTREKIEMLKNKIRIIDEYDGDNE